MELVRLLANQLGVTSEQAAGGAGAIFQLAQQRMSEDDFVQVADAVPAISDLMGKSPRYDAASRGAWGWVTRLGWLTKWFGGLGTLRPLASVFQTLGLSRDDIRRFTTFIIKELRHNGSDQAATLLQTSLR